MEGFPLDSHDEFSQVVAWHKSAKPQAPTIEQGPRTSKTEVYIVYLYRYYVHVLYVSIIEGSLEV